MTIKAILENNNPPFFVPSSNSVFPHAATLIIHPNVAKEYISINDNNPKIVI